MTPKSRHILLASLALLAIAHPISAARMPVGGGWTPIADINDPEIVKLAEFAVFDHNQKAKDHLASDSLLALDSLVKAESQVVSGINYRLEITASGGRPLGHSLGPQTYSAVVWTRAATRAKQLVSFEQIIKA
ncbi:hypothetical protein SASPL_146606 [Salvia splendens]|uniref:Cystatin domain-containing protein n=1 Tax=Salvia splendens TaxID=180675 RepID=A0A8X8WDL1_SALSN|nr:cysteine proteinase inhibitor 5-like [Salvia splendens]KAG6392389.1 hypothetical protein SASPL_146606 [Salvia splendens]